ncbi:hypothetical protein [Clostridium sp. D53t1_180928_C8]|uniref:tetratricopeptide repeat protein n=1 Tax=Clostridium sp. D53t1_180928_C8 TaxID=2787101 RepID=UPI0018A9C11F|nr:hypothetical protein [Clostridium sp. D53t1_180928_C8]
MSCWTVLGITPTRNIDKIKEAYVELSNSIDKNDLTANDLNLAYNKAISLATASIGDLNITLLHNSSFDILSALINSSIDDKAIDSIDKFMNKVNDIYNNPTLRFSKDSWINLLTLPILNNPTISQDLELEIIKYIYNHKYIPISIYALLDSRFNWSHRECELKDSLSIELVDFLINQINNPLPLTYNYLSNINAEQLDEYLLLREKAYLSFNSNEEKSDKSYLFDAYSIYNKDLDLLKLLGSYYLNKNDTLMALNYFREAINIDPNDMFCLSNFGHLLTETNQYSSAISYLEKYIKKLKNTLDIERIIDLAHCYHYSYDLQKAKDLYTLLIKLRPWDLSIKIELDNIKSKLSKDSVSLPLTIPIYKKYLNPYIEPFMNKLKEIYNNFSLRINENSWSELFSLPIASNETLFYLVEQNIIEFITNNKNIPKNIFTFLNSKFNWTSRHDELFNIYPTLKIDYLFNKLYFNEILSYDSLKDISSDVLEEYIEVRSLAYDLINNDSNNTEEYLNKALNLYDGDFELYKLFGQYYLNKNLYYDAIKNFKIAISLKDDDYYSICSLALLLTKTEKYKEALYYLNKSVNTPAGAMLLDNEDFLTKYAISFYYTNDLINAKKYFKKLYKINSGLKFINIYLKNINDRLSGKKRKVIPVIAITDSNYSTSKLKSKTKITLSNIITKFKSNIAN